MEDDSDHTRVLADEVDIRALSDTVIAERYEIKELIGAGGMGAVYRVFDNHVREFVALKILQQAGGAGDDSPAVERFRREVRLARRVAHRNATRMYDLGRARGCWYLTMELVRGESLHELLRREHRIPVARAASIIAAVCDGLAAVHEAGVVHRDIKPGNILIEEGGRVVLTDFGIAKQLTAAGDEADSVRTIGAIGTPGYMAPEQAAGLPVDERVDVYALGMILYRAVTGTHPSEEARVNRHKRMAPPDPRQVLPVPQAFAELVTRCLSWDPAERPASAAAVASALRAFVAPGDAAEPGGVARAQRGVESVSPGPPSRSPIRASGQRALAILPFRYRGSEDERYLAEALTDELVDVLSRTRGLWIIGTGATSRYANNRDPRTLGAELSVHVVVDGILQRAQGGLRISARLLDAETGYQIWSDRFSGGLEDVFELQDRMARKIAEALRVELTLHAHHGDATPEAVEYYLRGRQKQRSFTTHANSACALFERCLQLAPDFKPAIAAYALASLNAWFFSTREEGPSRKARAERAVESAIEAAPDLVDTQLAIGVQALHHGQFGRSIKAIQRALEIAPTCALAHQYLGMLKGEAGYSEEGVQELELALELDPTLNNCRIELARHAAFAGDHARTRRWVEETRARRQLIPLGFLVLDVRMASWLGDHEHCRRAAQELLESEQGKGTPLECFAAVHAGVLDPVVGMERVEAKLPGVPNPRFRSLITQITVETFAATVGIEGALELLHRRGEASADGVIVDITWLERCPLFKGMDALPGYAEVRAAIRQRAVSVWR